MVKALIDGGADVNEAQGDGMTGLHWAAERGNDEIAKLLVSAGADLESGTRIGRYTPLHLASKGGHTAVVSVLLEGGANAGVATESNGATPLHLAAAAADGEAVVSLLLRYGAEANVREASAGQTPLMFASAYDHAPSLKALLRGGADVALTTHVVDVLERVAVDREAARRFEDAIADYFQSYLMKDDCYR